MAEDKDTGKVILTSILAGGTVIGVAKLIDALTAKAAPPEGAVVFTPDEQTKEAIAVILALLADISVKLDNQDLIVSRLNLVSDAILSMPGMPELQYQLRVTDTEENLVIPAKTNKELYKTTAPDNGYIARVKLISSGKDIQYDLYIDYKRWAFNISDMVDQSIELPHCPGAWIEKATGDRYVFMFSGGEQVRFWNEFRLEARTTTATPVTILEGQILEKIFVGGV